ncbi:protein kinase [Demequina sp. SYSU T00068]|uniref:protein kinase domain-containing protein n=1 Tax=Demequina lignilytica TaxID=3051663 RepID=UPI00260E850D|nr:protein kinase [Demequina sp. SYSU T00068]MDN4489699.1 protein kinase [Demequina sp. SYSU T00068]
MDPDPKNEGSLYGLFQRIKGPILEHGNRLVVARKVIDELTYNSRRDVNALTDARAVLQIERARKVLALLDDPQQQRLVRTDLGDDGMREADDSFDLVLDAFGDKYDMCVLTLDITVQLSVRIINARHARLLVAGGLTREGLVAITGDQELYRKARRKLNHLKQRETRSRKDAHEIAKLESLLPEFLRLAGPFPSHNPTTKPTRPRNTARKPRDVNSGFRPFSKKPSFKGPDNVVEIDELPGTGDVVRYQSPSASGEVTLLGIVGKGGEGRVYDVGDGQVVKVFDEHHLTEHRKAKVKLLVQREYSSPGICFPSAIVTNSDGDFVGYMMPRAQGKELHRTIFRPRILREASPAWTKADLVDVCISFLEKVAYLHSLNIVVGDINPKNLLVDDQKQVTIIDCDSWQLEGYPCPVGWPDFTAPEIIDKRYPEFLRSLDHERFAIATMLFEILVTGTFPYSRVGGPGERTQLIKEGYFAFQFDGRSKQDQPLGAWKYMWSHIPFKVKELFWNTFHRDGTRYNNRPTIAEWLEAFHRYKNLLADGSLYDPMSNDVFPTRNKAKDGAPLYRCAKCKTSMCGTWSETKQDFIKHKICIDCMQDLPTCANCHRPKQSSELTNGLCGRCRQEKRRSVDESRVCDRCGKPFLTYGQVEFYENKGLHVQKRHKEDDPACIPLGVHAGGATNRAAGGARPAPRATASGASKTPRRPQPAANARPQTARQTHSQQSGLLARLKKWFS